MKPFIFKKHAFVLLFTFLCISSNYANETKPTRYITVYYFTQQTSQKDGHIVLSFVKSINCQWGDRGEYAIQKMIRDHYDSWFRYKPWSKEYKANVYVYESENSAKQARNRIHSSSGLYDDNDKYTDSYRYDCDYHLSFDEEKEWERQRQAKEEERRQAKAEQDRIAAEKKRIQNEKNTAEEKVKFTNWSNTTYKTLIEKLKEWDASTKQFLTETQSKYYLFNGEQLPSYLDIYALLIEKTILSPTLPAEEKSAIINRVLIDTYNYYNIYYDYNYNNVIPADQFKKINTIYAYGKAQFGFHPATNAYRYLSGITVSVPNPNFSEDIKEFEKRGIGYFAENKVDLALFEYFSALTNHNTDLKRVIKMRNFTDNTIQWRINLGYLLYYNGYYYDAYRMLNRERTTVDIRNKNFKSTSYWEIYSYEIAALYYSANYDLAIQEAQKFEEALLKQYPKKELINFNSIKISKEKNSLATDDMSLQHCYSRALIFWSKSLFKKNDIKTSAKILNPIVKMIKKGTPITYFGNNDNQLIYLLKTHEPSLYEKNNLVKATNYFKKINQTYDEWEKNTRKKTWEEINASKIEAFNNAYDNKNDNLAVTIAKELLPSLRYDFTHDNMVYKDLMTKAALASTCIKEYESAICFSNFAQLYTENKEESVAYLLLLTNIILSNNYTYKLNLDSNIIFSKPEDDNVKYDFEALLTTAASKKYDADYGYIILEHIQQELSRKKEKSIYLPYIYNAIKKTKPKTI
ncbi:hypothetical protein [Flavobacterium sp. J27]|uniref:hypothetical protein n=1 Tax=Flavobacterium sp. J27 TaxID=2060419 RepID=UPI0010319F66|nr:hypothetical protein [Flavobacterium sp. J27]